MIFCRLLTQLHLSFDSGVDMHFDMQDKTQSPGKRVRSLSEIQSDADWSERTCHWLERKDIAMVDVTFAVQKN